MNAERFYIIYDSRALYGSDNGTVMDTALTLDEAIAEAPDYGHCLVFSYAVDDEDNLFDERLEWIDPALLGEGKRSAPEDR